MEVTPRVTEGIQEAVPRKVRSISAPPTDPRRSLRLERKEKKKLEKNIISDILIYIYIYIYICLV